MTGARSSLEEDTSDQITAWVVRTERGLVVNHASPANHERADLAVATLAAGMSPS